MITMLRALAGLAATTALLAACGTQPTDDSASSSSSAAPAPSAPESAGVPPPLVPAMPLPENAVENAVAKLDELAAAMMEKSGVPGMAIAVVHGGKSVYAKGFGVKDNRKPADDAANAVDADTVFQLASVSKSLTGTVVAHQVGVKAVTWDTPVAEKLPWFALADPAVTRTVSIGDMLAHRSGLPDHAGDLLEDLGYDRRQVLDRLRDYPLDPFRISYAYTNYGFTAGAEATAVAAGKTWEDLSADVLYKPLGMTSTSSRYADFAARPDRAIGHTEIDGKYTPELVREPDPQSPAGGASSSVNDMTHWMAMVLGNGTYEGKPIVDGEALLPALTPQITSAPASEPAMRTGSYGFGFNVSTTSTGRQQISHSGAFESGAATNVLFLPAADVGIVVLTNGSPSGAPETLTAEFADLVQYGEVREDWWTAYHEAFVGMSQPEGSLVGETAPASPAPPAPLASYVGEYANPFWGTARITERDGGLLLALGPKFTVPLKHWDGNVFSVSFLSENSNPGSISKATFDGDKLTLEYWDKFGKGTFTK